MQTEIEVKFIDIAIDELRSILESNGASLAQPMRLMRRAIIETPELTAKNAFIRVRDEGERHTLTYKQFDEISLTGAKEIETEVSDFSAMLALLEQVELVAKSYQESRRETWHFGDVEVVIDEWPHLRPYAEIEGPSEEAVKSAAANLGFNWDSAVFGKVTEVYQRQYPNGDASQLVNCKRVVFDQPLPSILSGTHTP
jgi:adenylate cyclase class 2